MPAPDPVIGTRRFVGDITRVVRLDELTGRQYVFDDDGNRVYGVWIIDPDEGDEPQPIEAKRLD